MLPIITTRWTFRKNRELSAFTGCNYKKFAKLLPVFILILSQKRKSDSVRKRKVGGGRTNSLSCPAEQLIFILYYLKCYPTFSALGVAIGASHTTAQNQVKFLLEVLYETLNTLKMIPPREFKDAQELKTYLQTLGDVKDLIIDATERRIQRPRNKDDRAAVYSGKKKTFTVKNTIMTLLSGFIVFLGYSTQGTVHDYELLKIELLWYEGIIDWFKDFNLYVDSGYQGILEDFSVKKLFIPHKKARKTKDNPKPTLSDEQREYNKELAKTRVLVEHAIGSMKVFNILNHPFRNKKHYLEDKVIAIAAGLHNLSY